MSYTMFKYRDDDGPCEIFQNGNTIKLTKEEMQQLFKDFNNKDEKDPLIRKEVLFNAAISENSEITIGGKIYIIDELTVNNHCAAHTFSEHVLLGRCEIRAVLFDKENAKEHTAAFLTVPAKEGYFRVLFLSSNLY